MDEQTPQPSYVEIGPGASAPRSARSRAAVTLAAVAVGAAAFGVANFASAAGSDPGAPVAAASGTATPTPLTPPTEGAVPPPPGPDRDGDGPRGGHHGFGGGFGGGPMGIRGMGPALHGEFVVQKSEGTYETVAMQEGVVTEVSSTSITVKSADDYSRTYKVTADTLVNAARDGIGSVKVGNTVHVGATVAGSTATATDVVDVTTLEKNGGPFLRQRPGAPKPTASTSAA